MGLGFSLMKIGPCVSQPFNFEDINESITNYILFIIICEHHSHFTVVCFNDDSDKMCTHFLIKMGRQGSLLDSDM